MIESVSDKALFDGSSIEDIIYKLETEHNLRIPTTEDDEHSDIIIIDGLPYLKASSLKTIKCTHKYKPDSRGKSIGLILLSNVPASLKDSEGNDIGDYEVREESDHMHHLYIAVFED